MTWDKILEGWLDHGRLDEDIFVDADERFLMPLDEELNRLAHNAEGDAEGTLAELTTILAMVNAAAQRERWITERFVRTLLESPFLPRLLAKYLGSEVTVSATPEGLSVHVTFGPDQDWLDDVDLEPD